MVPEWLYYTTSSKVPEKKQNCSIMRSIASSIFKKEIRDPMMYVILLLITIILFLAIFFEGNIFSNQ